MAVRIWRRAADLRPPTSLALPIAELPGAADLHFASRLLATDAVVLMTHSFEQDSRIIASILGDARKCPPAYIGILGPQRRTREVLAEAARLLHLANPEDRAEEWLAELHAPTGIDLGAETPATIAALNPCGDSESIECGDWETAASGPRSRSECRPTLKLLYEFSGLPLNQAALAVLCASSTSRNFASHADGPSRRAR